jgi:hypothetical protein
MTPTTWSGSCHCGAVRFRFRSGPITSGLRCNCSVCIRKGLVMSSEYLELDALEGREALTLYIFGDKLLKHWFCATCGIYPFAEKVQEPGRYRVNLGCVEGVDSLALSIRIANGKAF